MKVNKKMVLVAAVLSAISYNSMANNVISSDSTNILIHGNGTDNKVTNSHNVNIVGSANEVKNSFNSNIVGFKSSTIDGGHSLAIGNYAGASGARSIAIGDNTDAYAMSMADYNNGVLRYDWNTGKENPVTGVGAVAIGSRASASVEMNTAVGYLAESAGNYNTAIGSHSVAIGDPHKADSKYAGTTNVKGVFSIANAGGYKPMYYLVNSPVSANTYEDSNEPSGFGNIGEFTRQLQGVAAGKVSADSTDAVNGSQLYTEIKEVRETFKVPMDWLENHEGRIQDVEVEAKKHATVVDGDNTTVTTATNDNGGVEYKVNVDKYLRNLHSADFVSDNAGNDHKVSITSTDVGVSGTDPMGNTRSSHMNKDGFGASSDNQYSMMQSSFLHFGDTAKNEGADYSLEGIRLANNDDDPVEITKENISFGNRQVHDVKAGESDTDAVNVSQLNKLGSQVNINTQDITELKGKIGNTTTILNESKSYTDSKFNDANAYTDRRIAKAGAANAALSGLKYLDYDANHKFVAAASFGQYKGATSGAIGIAYQPNEDVLVHLGTTIGSEYILNGGVSIRVGDSNKGVKSNTKNLAKEMDMIKAENAELKAELAEIKAMLASK